MWFIIAAGLTLGWAAGAVDRRAGNNWATIALAGAFIAGLWAILIFVSPSAAP